jgi:DNA invertase Pin-like site-specific DNA recombinase
LLGFDGRQSMTLFPLPGGVVMRVAIYARVSTDDKGQDPENQLRELRDWVINSGHIISREYVDYDSGRKGAEKRKQFAALFDDATLFWALERISAGLNRDSAAGLDG